MPVVPKDNVKKDWPSAKSTPCIEISCMRGCNIYCTPSNAPSKVNDFITIISRNINNNGIMILEAFSRPPSTPNITMTIVNAIKMPCPTTVIQGLLIMPSKLI